jgi:RNA polymerase sigma factor (sigma-70 family)
MTATRFRTARALHTATRDDPRPDSELLAQFVTHHDAAAFAAVVHRHGPLVYGVCRRTLGATADADDAFQAAFLVLAQKAGTVPWRGGLGPWLFGVAHRIARKARFRRDRRFAVEKQVDAMPHPETIPPDCTESDELSRAFDEELAALPEDMRRAVVLCELQGRSRQQAAKELRIGEGTLSSRLARARKLLRDRLAKRGFGLVIPPAVVIPAKLTATTVGLVNGSAGVVPAAVAALTQEAVKAMTISKLKLGAVLAAVAVGVSGLGLAVGGDDIKPPAKADAQVKPTTAAEKAKPNAVATINGNEEISREEFGEYLIRKHGAKEIEGFVSQKVVESEARKRGVKVSDAELQEAMAREIRYFAHRNMDFRKAVLLQTGMTEEEWQQDILHRQVILEKLCSEDVTVTDDDLKTAFAVRFGGRRHVQIVEWPKGTDKKAVQDHYERAKREPLVFEQLAVKVQCFGGPKGGDNRLAMYDDFQDGCDKVVRDAAYALKTSGQVSDLIETDDGSYAIKLVEIIPAQTGKQFEDEKAALLKHVTYQKRMGQAGKRYFELNAKAKPVFHLQPNPKAYPQPVPAMK